MTKLKKCFKRAAITAATACVGVALLPSLLADEWDKKTMMTVNEPLEVPSCCTPSHTVVLQPGQYVMVLKDSLSDRHIVMIFDKDQKHLITTIVAIPNYRLEPTGKTVFKYWEVPAGQPTALRAWFYPGDNFGQEFAYPKQAAAQIAAFAKAPVPAIATDTSAADDLKTAPLVAVDESGQTTGLAQAMPMAAMETPAPAATPVAEAPAPEPVMQPTPEALPHTASTMPLVGLAGLVSLALFAVLGLRFRTRHSFQG
jgi:LPXTG-motif cell wall-anchored protein